MLQNYEKPIISNTAKTNSELAKNCKDNKNEFFYWLGYWNGQQSISEKVNG